MELVWHLATDIYIIMQKTVRIWWFNIWVSPTTSMMFEKVWLQTDSAITHSSLHLKGTELPWQSQTHAHTRLNRDGLSSSSSSSSCVLPVRILFNYCRSRGSLYGIYLKLITSEPHASNTSSPVRGWLPCQLISTEKKNDLC